MQAPEQALPPGRQPSAVPTQQYLRFLLGSEVFALDIGCVREIIQRFNVTVVPLMPAFVRGVINLRGAVVPVIDLQARFGRASAQIGKKTCIILFNATLAEERVELGLLVDAVHEVIEIAQDQIEPPPQFGSPIRRDFVRGIARVGREFIIILASERALDIGEMAALAQQA